MPEEELGENMQEIAAEDATQQEPVEQPLTTEGQGEEEAPKEEDLEKVEPEKAPEVSKVTEDERKGLIEARKAEAEKRRQIQAELDREKGRREALEQIVQQRQIQPEEEIDPNQTVTVGEVQELLRRKDEETAFSKQKDLITKCASDARENYKDAEFTYDDALEFAQKDFSKETFAAILNDKKNPAQLLYDLALAKNPQIRKKQNESIQKEAVQKTAEVINRHLNQPQTLSKVGGSNRTLDQIKRYEQMSPEEFEAEVQKTLAQGAE